MSGKRDTEPVSGWLHDRVRSRVIMARALGGSAMIKIYINGLKVDLSVGRIPPWTE